LSDRASSASDDASGWRKLTSQYGAIVIRPPEQLSTFPGGSFRTSRKIVRGVGMTDDATMSTRASGSIVVLIGSGPASTLLSREAKISLSPST